MGVVLPAGEMFRRVPFDAFGVDVILWGFSSSIFTKSFTSLYVRSRQTMKCLLVPPLGYPMK
jgi:hypothetical protein